MRVAVLGAGGTIAPAIVRDLAESDEVDDLLLLDLDEPRAQQVAERCGGAKARAAFADARASGEQPESLARALEGSDVLVNSASYRVNLDAMRACLAAGSHYVDLGGLYWMTARQLELGPQFQDAGLLGLLGIGSAPGKTNLMALHGVGELGGGAEAIHVSAAGRDLDPPDGFSIPYALRTLLDELTMRPVVLRDGAPEEIEPLSDGGVVDFGPPIGKAETIKTLHSELLTFGDSFGCGEASFRLSLSPQLLSALRELTGAPDEEVDRVAADAQPPLERRRSLCTLWRRSEADGRYGSGRSPRQTGPGTWEEGSCRRRPRPRPRCGCWPGRASPRGASFHPSGASSRRRCSPSSSARGCRFETTSREEVRA